MEICMEPIGYVTNSVVSPVDTGWGNVESRIVLRDELASALAGLADFSHILVVFWMQQAGAPTSLQRRPQGRDDMPELGLFAQRSKHRLNPVGITTVHLLGVAGSELLVRGLDAIDGTPVLDIKPYYPAYDRPDGARVPEWVGRLMQGYF